MKTYLSSALIAAAAIAAPALAQDAAAAGPSFTGPRIEAHAGYDRLGTDSTNGGIDGVTYGVGAGYDFALGGNGLIGGVEVNGDFSNTDARSTSAGTTVGIKAKRDLDASVRVGTVLGSRALLYAKVGYANARFTGSVTSGATAIRSSDNVEGVRAGVGVEYALGTNAYAKAEYRYTNYEQGLDRNQVLGGIGFRF